MKIGWDVDGVLANETKAYLEQYVCPRLGMQLTAEDVPESNYVNIHPSLTIPLIRELFGKANDDGMFENLEPYPYVDIPGRLPQHEHYAITHRHRKTITQTYRWCMEHNLPFKGIWFSDSFHTPGGLSKTEIARYLGIGAFIEDNAENAVSLSEVVPHMYLINRPWNRGRALPPNIIRVDSCDELYAHLEKIGLRD